MSEFDILSKRYGQALGAQRDSKSIVNQARARFAEHLHGIDAPTPARWRRWVLAPAMVAAAVALTVTFWPEAPLGVSLRGSADPVDFVQASATQEAVVDFSDGSEVVVHESSQLRVLGVTAQGAQVALERGAARVSVVHRQKTKWMFTAGPYRVHVVGTRFELKWNPETGGLAVEMDDGIVEVDGPGLARQRVTSRQKLEAFAEPASASLYLESEAEPVAELDAEETEPPTVGVRPTRRAPSRVAVVKPPRPSGPSWRYLADKGDSFGAMHAAEQAGFTWLTNSMPRGDVLELGDVALRAKQPARATEAWLAVRERFGGTVDASEAALRLGHLAEAQSQVNAAARWYTQAASEAPNAATAPQALGDLLDLMVRANRTKEAKRVALDYLKRFKNGPKAQAAHDVLAPELP